MQIGLGNLAPPPGGQTSLPNNPPSYIHSNGLNSIEVEDCVLPNKYANGKWGTSFPDVRSLPATDQHHTGHPSTERQPNYAGDAYGREVQPPPRLREHPETRDPRRDDDGLTEFVRTEWSETVYKKVRTYSSIPRQIECYSCMSLAYQNSWKYLQTIYIYPKVFTDRCKDPGIERGMPTVGCSTVCISMFEPDIEAGVLIGHKYIRGCLDRVLRNGFNQTALRTHRFHQNNHCRTLSRANLFNPARSTDPAALGDVQLCSCYGDRCNGSNSASFVMSLLPVLIAVWRIR